MATACWICLCEGGDDDDGEETLVRDCSCRGESAGYAHKSCIIQFATMKSTETSAKNHTPQFDMPTFERAWHTCPNCNQQYQNQLRLDIASAYLVFAESTYGHPDNNGDLDKRKIMNALKVNIDSILESYTGSKLMRAEVMKPAHRIQGENLLNKLLSMTLQVKNNTHIASWRHMPKASYEYQEYKKFSRAYEAYSYERLGTFYGIDNTKESLGIAIKHWQKALVIFKLIGCESESNFTANQIAKARDLLREGNGTTAPIRQDTKINAVKSSNERYQQDVQAFGEHDQRTIRTGIEFADLLREFDYIRAERLITKLSDSSRQILGLDHACTKDATHLMNYCMKRLVLILPDKSHYFQAIRYEDDGDTLVVIGPILNPRQVDDEREFQVTSDLVFPMIGCPVVCHGLTGATHLNGKLGQVRSARESKTGLRAEILFEDTNLNPASVKFENLRIVFDLPTEAVVEM
jgi:hypothetical protein